MEGSRIIYKQLEERWSVEGSRIIYKQLKDRWSVEGARIIVGIWPDSKLKHTNDSLILEHLLKQKV